MTVCGWLLAGKAHIGHDRALAHWSRLVCFGSTECHRGIKHLSLNLS